jgi:hypothetical protein
MYYVEEVLQMSEMGGGKVSAAMLQVYLKGVDYPVNKQQLIEKAKSNGAPDNVMMWLNKLPERQYQYPTEVEQEFGKMK